MGAPGTPVFQSYTTYVCSLKMAMVNEPVMPDSFGLVRATAIPTVVPAIMSSANPETEISKPSD